MGHSDKSRGQLHAGSLTTQSLPGVDRRALSSEERNLLCNRESGIEKRSPHGHRGPPHPALPDPELSRGCGRRKSRLRGQVPGTGEKYTHRSREPKGGSRRKTDPHAEEDTLTHTGTQEANRADKRQDRQGKQLTAASHTSSREGARGAGYMDEGPKAKTAQKRQEQGRRARLREAGFLRGKKGFRWRGESESMPYNFFSASFTSMKSSGYFKNM